MADLRTDYKDDLLDTSVNTQRKYRMVTNDDGTVSFVDETVYAQNGDTFGASEVNKIHAAVNLVNESLNVRYNGDTDMVQIYFGGKWVDWKRGWLGEIDLSLTARKLGAPSNTGDMYTNKRTWNTSTYVLGISLNNYYYPSNITGTINSDGTITTACGSGASTGAYGMALPIALESGATYKLTATSNCSTACIGANFYNSSGDYSEGKFTKTNGGTVSHHFTVPTGYSTVLLWFTAGKPSATAVFSDIHLERVAS